MINPAAGVVIASRCMFVNLGSKSPLLVLFKSKIAEPSGALPSLLIATWAIVLIPKLISIAKKIIFVVFIVIIF